VGDAGRAALSRAGWYPRTALRRAACVVATLPLPLPLLGTGRPACSAGLWYAQIGVLIAWVANPLDNSVNPTPAAAAWRLAHSCPLTHTLIGYGK
jgi:hypothetical protein